MSLNKMSKEEIELLSYTDIAKLYLEENKTTLNTAELFKVLCVNEWMKSGGINEKTINFNLFKGRWRISFAY